jgi:N-acetyl-anhydromuramyl-L-alanine amidase AmpD
LTIPFVQAAHCGPARPGVPIWLIVVHTMEAPEKPHTANNVAFWFAGTKAPQASAHYCVDSDDTVQCVKEDVVAWAAPGANKNGIHIEHAGYASQSSSDWQDTYSQKMLLRSAALAADIAKRYGIPVVKLTPEELAKNPEATGFCGHVDVTLGRNNGHGHTDPGASFPWYQYLEMVVNAMTPTDPAPAPDDEITLNDNDPTKGGGHA